MGLSTHLGASPPPPAPNLHPNPPLPTKEGTGGGLSRRAMAVAALVMIAVILVSTNIVAARFLTPRRDLTAERLYTLSPGTRHTLARIDEPITLHFYYSTQLK